MTEIATIEPATNGQHKCGRPAWASTWQDQTLSRLVAESGGRIEWRPDRGTALIHGVLIHGAMNNHIEVYPERVLASRRVQEMFAAPVYLDHRFANEEGKLRSVRDLIGRAINVCHQIEDETLDPDSSFPSHRAAGLYATLCLDVMHPMTPRVVYLAAVCPSALAISGSLERTFSDIGPPKIVNEVTRVESVDLVTKGGHLADLFGVRTWWTPSLAELVRDERDRVERGIADKSGGMTSSPRGVRRAAAKLGYRMQNLGGKLLRWGLTEPKTSLAVLPANIETETKETNE